MSASPVVHWFRRDQRLHDPVALQSALKAAQERRVPLLPVVVEDPALTEAPTRWGFARRGPHRARWEAEATQGLEAALARLGAPLTRLHGPTATVLADWCRAQGVAEMWCEDIPCPEEQDQVVRLQAAGLRVHTVWVSTLVAPETLPFAPTQVPDVFTAFRQKLEAAGGREASICPTAATWAGALHLPDHTEPDAMPLPGSEAAALAHLASYCTDGHPHHYKATRNAPDTRLGTHASSHWSPWLATGALSARTAMAAIRRFEAERGANEGTYWLWFELLWRDHFRWLHRKHGRALYRARGLSSAPLHLPPEAEHAQRLQQWREGNTGQPLVDAGMRELAATGWLSNRMRQIVASFWVHDLQGNWRAGAAWFEHALIDFDPCSNQGNWLYIAGRGTDPRGGRRFNPDKQAAEHDPDGQYRQRWLPHAG
jgi:deoxyribodipyrimidine photo-lyase